MRCLVTDAVIFGFTKGIQMDTRSIDVCQYYARRIPKQYGNYGSKHLVPPEHRITAYCKPTYVDPNKRTIYDR